MRNNQHTILIIDDDDRNIFALKAVLTTRGFSCHTATSAVQALGILEQETSIAIALVDMMMPGMDGYQLMTQLRSIPRYSGLKLIALTAQAMAGDQQKCLDAGADAYITKPVDVDLLLHYIDQYLNAGK